MNLEHLKERCPSGWRIENLGDVCKLLNDLRFPISADERKNMPGLYPYYGPTRVLDFLDHYRVEGRFVLISEDGDHFLKYRDVPMSLLVDGKFNVNNHAHLLQGSHGCITEWIFYFYHHISLIPFITRQGAGRFKLTKDALLKLPILVPPIIEQKRITDTLSYWTGGIEQLEQLIAAKTEFKRGLMQQLLTGRKRFKEFERQKWKQFHLGDVAIESELRNNGRLTEKSLYAVTKAYGMIPMRERVQGESVERCKVVSKDGFAYNPMRLNIGSIAKWNNEEDVLVSPDYVVFQCDETQLDPDFLNHYRRSHRWTKFVEKAGDGSVRVRIWFSHLAELKLSLPPLPEQRRIAAVLNTCDRELDLLREQLAELKKQKKGLMQKLLTGQIRVKVDEAQAIGA